MPGVFGAVGYEESFYKRLQDEFARPWGKCESIHIANGIIGGHAFVPDQTLHSLHTGGYFAIDGEASLYRSSRETIPFRVLNNDLELASSCKGNIVAVDPQLGHWFLASEWSGSFPLYYAHFNGGLLFCSRLKPLARILEDSPDLIAIREFLHNNYTLAGRSLYKNIHRLMPGQVLRYEPTQDKIYIDERSQAWVGIEEKDIIARSWNNLTATVRDLVDENQSNALMFSGGWDSRTLFAAMRKLCSTGKFLCYTHGDSLSRELRIVDHMCRSSGIELHREPIVDSIYDLELLKDGFDRSETATFPQWHRAGKILADRGVGCVTAGIYGEILGGHYGSVARLTGMRKMATLAAYLFGRQSTIRNGSNLDAFHLFEISDLVRPWYVKRETWDTTPDLKEAMNADIKADINRLRHRGIEKDAYLVEAFLAEHRGAQHINCQLLSCRASLNIAIPFANQDLFTFASRIPIARKIHNCVNREMLRQEAPDLLRFSTAATLVPGQAPIPLQEVSRLFRYGYEQLHWKLYAATGGRIGSPHFGWWNLEFLRTSNQLTPIVEDLKSDLWDKQAILNRIASVKADLRVSPGVFSQTLLKIYTLDLMLR